MTIHPSALIDSSAEIGRDVFIGPYAIIGPHTRLGDGCRIWPHVVLEHVALGEKCEVYPQASVGLAPQHLKDSGEGGRVEIGPRCLIREGVLIHRGTQLGGGVTRIGSDGFFMGFSHIAHDCQIGNNVILANLAQVAGHVEVADNAFISTMVGLHQFIRVGRGALVSGGSMVPMDVAPFCIAQGDRATLHGLNVVGMRRMGIDRNGMKRVKEAYRVVFQEGRTLEQALAHPALSVDDLNVRSFRDFLKGSKRGFLRPSGRGTGPEPEKESAL